MFKTKNSMPTAKSGGRKLKNDLILLLSLLIAIAILAICLYFFSEEANSVTVTIDGEIYGTYSINTDATIEIVSGTNGEGLNRLVIKDGEAYVSYATCPDGICTNHKPISRTGQSIICRPNSVVVTTKANKESITPDIVA